MLHLVHVVAAAAAVVVVVGGAGPAVLSAVALLLRSHKSWRCSWGRGWERGSGSSVRSVGCKISVNLLRFVHNVNAV